MEDEVKKGWEFSSIEDIVASTRQASSSKYAKEDIETYLLNPFKNHAKLREISDYFYYNNGIYKNIMNTFTNLPTLDYLILPSQKTLGKTQDKAYGTYQGKIIEYTDSINIKLTTRRILKSVAKYGAFVGYERSNGSEFYIQTLPLDYCRIKYKVGNDYQLEFNFKYFDKFWSQEDIDLAWEVYPSEFKKLYNKYKSDRKSRYPEWQMLDIKKTICILWDDEDPVFIPTYSSTFEALINNEDYKDLIKLGQKLEITKLIIQKVPVDKDGNIQIPKDMIKVFHEALKAVLPEGANGLTTPLDVTDVPFTNDNKNKEDLLEKAERGAFVSSGMTSAMFADNGGHTGLTMNIEIVTANIFAVLEKIEDVFDRKFTHIVNSKNYSFKLKFFRTTNVNVQENFDRMMKLLEIGGALTPILSLTGISPESYTTLLQIENSLKIKDLLIVPQSMHTQSANGDNKGGAPAKSDGKLSDEGAKAKDLGTNDPNYRE